MAQCQHGDVYEIQNVPVGKGELDAEKDVSPGELKDDDDDPDRE